MDDKDAKAPEASGQPLERFASAVVESLAANIAVLDEHGTILAVNRAWREFGTANGVSGAYAEGVNYLAVCDAAGDMPGAAVFAAGIRAVLAGGQPSFSLEYPCHCASEQRWFVGSVHPLLDDGPRRAVVSHVDVTVRKLAEEALEESRRILAHSQRMAQVGSWELDIVESVSLEDSPLRWSDECYRIFGYEPGSVTVTNELFLAAVHPEDRDALVAAAYRALREHSPYALEHRITRADGEECVVKEWGEFVGNSRGEPVRMVGTCQDITVQKRAEQELRNSEARLVLATQSANLGTWDVDLRTSRMDWSPRQRELFGFDAGAFDGRFDTAVARIHPDDRAGLLEAAAAASASASVFQNEHRVVLPDGRVRWLAGSGRFLYDDAGFPVRMLGVTLDITDRKRAEQHLSRYAKRLETFHRIDQAILSAGSPGEIARVALVHLAALVPYWAATVMTLDFDAEEIHTIASLGAAASSYPAGSRAPFHEIASSELEQLRQGRPIIVDDRHGPPISSVMFERLWTEGMRSCVRMPLLYRGELIGSMNLGSDRPDLFAQEELDIAKEVADQMAIVLRDAMLFEEVTAARSRLESLSRRLIHTAEEERRRISRELHDQAGQNLTVLKLLLQGAARALGAEHPAASSLDEGMEITGQILGQIRDISLALRPSHLDDLGLVAALRSLVDRQARVGGLTARFVPVADNPEFRLDAELETACFRVVQEATTNVVRYACAKTFCVELYLNEDELEVVVTDDGIGFDVDAAFARAEDGIGLGLIGMRERVKLLGGMIAIRSKPGAGTTISASFPALGVRGRTR